MNRKRIHPNLKSWRDSERLSQEQAAQRIGVTQPYYSKLETGRAYPHRTLAKTIVDTTGVPLETVLGVA